MKLLFESVVLLCLICSAFGQSPQVNPAATHHAAAPKPSDTTEAHALECFDCVFTPTAVENPGSHACLNPTKGTVNTTHCPSGACGYWAGNLSIGYTVIRSCGVQISPGCRVNQTIKASIEREGNVSWPLSQNDLEALGNKTESCGQDLCNNGKHTQVCSVIVGANDHGDHSDHGDHDHSNHDDKNNQPSQPNQPSQAGQGSQGGQHGGNGPKNGGMGSAGITTLFYHISFLLCNLFFLQISV